jgi:electron transport complex protein RnfD
MKRPEPRLLVQPAPLLKQRMDTPQAMRDVFYALLPATAAGLWLFGLGAWLVLLAGIAGAVMSEWLFSPPEQRRERLSDASALLTGLLLGLTLPPGLPLWIAFAGGVMSIGIGKLLFGGLGQNLFNPALVGRAFLLGTFPTPMTTWPVQHGSEPFFTVYNTNLALPLMHVDYDGVTAATPLGLMKFEQHPTGLFDLVIGNTNGSVGETSGLLLLLGGVYLLMRRDIDWRIPTGILATAGLFALVLHLFDSTRFAGPFATIFSGGMMLGAIYMATDPVTSPLTPKGAWIFACGIGFLVVLIRVFGGLPEGVMYAILLMNAATPLIDRWSQPRLFGRKSR